MRSIICSIHPCFLPIIWLRVKMFFFLYYFHQFFSPPLYIVIITDDDDFCADKLMMSLYFSLSLPLLSLFVVHCRDFFKEHPSKFFLVRIE